MSTTQTILFIDDDEDILELLTKSFIDLGYKVLGSNTGKQGLEYFHNQSIDLIVCDLVMPEIGGIEVLYEVRNKSKHLPVLILTGADDPKSQNLAIQYGATDILRKPIDIGLLEKRFSSCLEMAKAPQA